MTLNRIEATVSFQTITYNIIPLHSYRFSQQRKQIKFVVTQHNTYDMNTHAVALAILPQTRHLVNENAHLANANKCQHGKHTTLVCTKVAR